MPRDENFSWKFSEEKKLILWLGIHFGLKATFQLSHHITDNTNSDDYFAANLPNFLFRWRPYWQCHLVDCQPRCGQTHSIELQTWQIHRMQFRLFILARVMSWMHFAGGAFKSHGNFVGKTAMTWPVWMLMNMSRNWCQMVVIETKHSNYVTTIILPIYPLSHFEKHPEHTSTMSVYGTDCLDAIQWHFCP